MKTIALIGAGYWGKNILRNLYEMGFLHSVCETNPQLVKDFKQLFPDTEYLDSVEEVLRNPAIKAVAIATPAITHYAIVKQALMADKDVFVEKPLALTVKEGEELAALANSRKKILMVGHILQYHPTVIKLKEMISKGELGRIRYIYSNRLNIGKLRTEENILWSFAPHDISVILMLLGEEPIAVSSFGGDYLSPGINDVTLTTMRILSISLPWNLR